MKNILKILLIISVFFAIGFLKIDAASKVDIHLFYGDYCPHCAKEIIMLKDLAKKDQRINLLLYEMSNPKNHQLAVEMAKNLNTTITGVPFTVIGDKYFTGYGEGYNKEAIIKAITEELGEEIEEKHNYKFKVPLLGEVETKDLSLPAIAILMGILDGFNPCAMWVLLFLISMLIGMKNKKEMWLLGSTFIISSALVYALFMVAWLNLALFMGSLTPIRILIALVALTGGVINFKSYFDKSDGCTIIDEKKRKKIFKRIKKFTNENKLLLALGGVILLAFSVNLIELLCSLGLPVIFTQILAINKVSTFLYVIYIFIYIFFFMLDDIIVFFIAMSTLELTGVSTKYGKMSNIIGGILMIIIGLLLIFNPSLLMFN